MEEGPVKRIKRTLQLPVNIVVFHIIPMVTFDVLTDLMQLRAVCRLARDAIDDVQTVDASAFWERFRRANVPFLDLESSRRLFLAFKPVADFLRRYNRFAYRWYVNGVRMCLMFEIPPGVGFRPVVRAPGGNRTIYSIEFAEHEWVFPDDALRTQSSIRDFLATHGGDGRLLIAVDLKEDPDLIVLGSGELEDHSVRACPDEGCRFNCRRCLVV